MSVLEPVTFFTIAIVLRLSSSINPAGHLFIHPFKKKAFNVKYIAGIVLITEIHKSTN